MLRIRNAVKAVILVLGVAAVSILSCSSELAVTGTGHGASRYDIAISGTVYAPNMVPIEGATVKWYCVEHPSWVLLGQTKSGEYGTYEIEHTWGTAHGGHEFIGVAKYYLYNDTYNYTIDNFQSSNIPYEDRDFFFTE
jgi:hypothetical protein